MATDRFFFFGCRCSSHDFLYREELAEFQSQGVVTNLFTAFSRSEGKKVYVQHRMQEEPIAARISNLILEKSAAVYICGDGNAMAKDVQNALAEVLSQKFGGDIVAAKNYIEEMKEKRRILIDIWM